MTEDSYLYGRKSGIVRTDVYCHNCSRNFIAHIDYDLDGDHVVECPRCGHEHFRKIAAGVVTESRFNAANRPDSSTTLHRDRQERGMWKSNSVPMETATVQHFLRERWLNRSDR